MRVPLGWNGGGRKINWVSWRVVCQPREVGGLGVRDVCRVNLSLLAKWRWRLLQDNEALLRNVLVERYGVKMGELLEDIVDLWPRNASRWWKDLVVLSKGAGAGADWFNEEVVRSVGNGSSTSFWRVAWRGDVPFMLKYNRLFSIVSNKKAMIHEMWRPNSRKGVGF